MIIIALLLIFNFILFLPTVYSNVGCNIENQGDKIIFKAENIVRLRIFHSVNNYSTLEIKECISQQLSLNSYCKADSKVILITHGFLERWRMETRWDWVDDMKNEFFQSSEIDNLCVIAVDWKELAAGGVVPNYWKAISNMRIGGDLIANVLNNSHTNIKNVHCIGFSLGAHMCSILYKIYYDKFKVKPGRLTGLDPAGPFFKEKSDSERISRSDADFVDVIHTTSEFGLYINSGQMDFYTNTGKSKKDTCKDIRIRDKDSDTKIILYEDPNANPNEGYEEVEYGEVETKSSNAFEAFFKKLFNKIKTLPQRVFIKTHQFFGCGHLMAVRFFIYSINYCKYEAKYCESGLKKCYTAHTANFPRMGYHADKTDPKYKFSNSSFYVETSFTVPFCHDILPHMAEKAESYNKKLAQAGQMNQMKIIVLYLCLTSSMLIKKLLSSA